MVLGVTLIDVAFYWTVMITTIIVAFDARRFAVPAVLPVILGTVLFYSALYWLSISQPRYNFPVVPLFGVLAAGGLESVVNGTARRAVQSSGWQRGGVLSLVALFLCLQIEWILIVYLHFLVIQSEINVAEGRA